MPLPTPALDNRRFQDIVDEAKRLIPQLCPEWTDHNVSDPGIALVELFAWMTEMLIYRANQVPDKNYIKFLEMIGVKLSPPTAASAPVTFYLSTSLSSPESEPILIPQDTEVATVRTETSPAIIFTTEKDMKLGPPSLKNLMTKSGERYISHDLQRLASPGHSIPIFSAKPAIGDALCFGMETDLSNRVIAVTLKRLKRQGESGTHIAEGVTPDDPPRDWQVWQSEIGGWVSCPIEEDGTRGFTESGEIVLRLPAMSIRKIEGIEAFWLRCALIEPRSGQGAYIYSPEITGPLRLETRGGTVSSRHAVTVNDEILGHSDGVPGQTFKLLNAPLLARRNLIEDTNGNVKDTLIVEPPGSEPEQWREVEDFGASKSTDRHYLLDYIDGTTTLGPALLQPDGAVYRFGAVPPKGSRLRFSRYQFGGGVIGNVPQGAITVPKTAIPYVAKVYNWKPSIGGRNAQTIEDAKLRAAQDLRMRRAAVTAEDFVYHATQVPGIARALCLAPGELQGAVSDVHPGNVYMIVLPESASPYQPNMADLQLSDSLRKSVLSRLSARATLGIGIQVRQAEAVTVVVQATLYCNDPGAITEVRERAALALEKYLNPYAGGPQGEGWPFGRDLHLSEIYGVLLRIPKVERADDVKMFRNHSDNPTSFEQSPARLELKKFQVLCSGQHSVKVEVIPK